MQTTLLGILPDVTNPTSPLSFFAMPEDFDHLAGACLKQLRKIQAILWKSFEIKYPGRKDLGRWDLRFSDWWLMIEDEVVNKFASVLFWLRGHDVFVFLLCSDLLIALLVFAWWLLRLSALPCLSQICRDFVEAWNNQENPGVFGKVSKEMSWPEGFRKMRFKIFRLMLDAWRPSCEQNLHQFF